MNDLPEYNVFNQNKEKEGMTRNDLIALAMVLGTIVALAWIFFG